jgi:hypothetical protein
LKELGSLYYTWCFFSARSFLKNNLQEIDPKVENDDLSSEGMEGFLSELTNAIQE